MPTPAPDELAARPTATFPAGDLVRLNHGAFGLTPLGVRAAQLAWVEHVEASPERFFRDELEPSTAHVRTALATFLGCDPAALALVANTTAGVQVVLSAAARWGDHLVITDQTYDAVAHAAAVWAREPGRSLDVVAIEDLLGQEDPDAVVDRVVAAARPSTALVIIDQITSPTAWRLPSEEISRALAGRVRVLVDGAHGAGQLALPLAAEQAIWVGSLHKWTFTPRSVGVIVAPPSVADELRPLVDDIGSARAYPDRFLRPGTTDPSAMLAIPDAIGFPATLGLSWADVRSHNADLLAMALAHLVDLGLGEGVHDEGLAMGLLRTGRRAAVSSDAAVMRSFRDHGVEVAATIRPDGVALRLSTQLYTSTADVEQLAAVIPQVLR